MRTLKASNILILLIACTPNGVSASPGDKVPEATAGSTFTAEEQAILELTNSERTKAKLPHFKPDPSLMRMAREHSRSMARLQQLSHTIEGRSFSVRLIDSGYQSRAAGENVAEGQVDAAEAVKDWMNSPGHRTNMMNVQYSHIGVAVAVSKSGRRFYTQVFAQPSPLANSSVVDRAFKCPSCRPEAFRAGGLSF